MQDIVVRLLRSVNVGRRGSERCEAAATLQAGALPLSRNSGEHVRHVPFPAADDARLVLLGTAGGPTPKLSRSAPAQAVVVRGSVYLFDAGNGVAGQLRRAGLPLGRLRAIGITHHHSDHMADLGTVGLLAWGDNLTSEVAIFGPPPIRTMVDAFLEFARVDVSTRILDEGRPPLDALLRISEIERPGLIFSDKNVRVTAARVHHPPMDAWAYRIDTAARSFVISGDTTPCDELVALATGAQVLVHEAMYLPGVDQLVSEVDSRDSLRHHLEGSHTATSEVGAVARAAGVETLVLSHLVPSDGDIPEEIWAERPRQDFGGHVIVGRDLMWL